MAIVSCTEKLLIYDCRSTAAMLALPVSRTPVFFVLFFLQMNIGIRDMSNVRTFRIVLIFCDTSLVRAQGHSSVPITAFTSL